MAYNDPQYNVQVQGRAVGTPASGVSLGTSTASGTNTFAPAAGTALQGSYVLPKFVNPVQITGVKVYCTGAPAANLTAVTFIFLNGTNTFAVATNVGAAANADVDATMNASTVASNGSTTSPGFFQGGTAGQASLKVITTATASALAQGTFAVDFIVKGLFT